MNEASFAARVLITIKLCENGVTSRFLADYFHVPAKKIYNALKHLQKLKLVRATRFAGTMTRYYGAKKRDSE